MPFVSSPLMHKTTRAIAVLLCLAMAAAALCGCAGQPASDDAGATASLDTSSWKTLGDALAAETESMAASWDDTYYVTVFKAGDSIVRAVAKMSPELRQEVDDATFGEEGTAPSLEDVAGKIELVSAEDITGERMGQDELDQLKGKTGKDLVDAGWTFQDYYMYGGEQTGAAFSKGYLAYSFVFNVKISEDDYNDEGASVMDAAIAEAEFQGPSNEATDPTLVG